MEKQPTFEELLRMKVLTTLETIDPPVEFTPDFRVAVQEITEKGVRIIVHANGHDSSTCDYWVIGDKLTQIGNNLSAPLVPPNVRFP